jgi:hypothetical protein
MTVQRGDGRRIEIGCGTSGVETGRRGNRPHEGVRHRQGRPRHATPDHIKETLV